LANTTSTASNNTARMFGFGLFLLCNKLKKKKGKKKIQKKTAVK
jgi:hypothetical protein